MTRNNPFIIGKSIPYGSFVGRQDELFDLFQAINGRMNKLLVGEPNIGKTTLLYQLQEKVVWQKYLSDSAGWAFIIVHGLTLPINTTPGMFWHSILRQAMVQWNHPDLTSIIKPYLESRPDTIDKLDEIFKKAEDLNKVAVLLLDEFDVIVGLPELAKRSFWGGLRKLCAHWRSVCFLSASREGQSQLTDRLEKLKAGGSPLLNFATERRLGPFTALDFQSFFPKMQGETRVLTPCDQMYIRQLAGFHPFLLQVTSYHCWNARGLNGHVDYSVLLDRVVESTDSHFADTWRYLGQQDPKVQDLALLLVLARLERTSHDLQLLKNITKHFSSQLKLLKQTSLVDTIDGQQQITSDAFVHWVATNKLPQILSDPDAWLNQYEKLWGGITRKQRNTAIYRIQQIYNEARVILIEIGSKIPGELTGP